MASEIGRKPFGDGRGAGAALACLLTFSMAACDSTAQTARPFIPGMTPKVTESQDFVKANRPADPDFIPVSAPEVRRPVQPLRPDQVKAAEGDLAGAARRQQGVKAAGDAARRGVLARSPRPAKVE